MVSNLDLSTILINVTVHLHRYLVGVVGRFRIVRFKVFLILIVITDAADGLRDGYKGNIAISGRIQCKGCSLRKAFSDIRSCQRSSVHPALCISLQLPTKKYHIWIAIDVIRQTDTRRRSVIVGSTTGCCCCITVRSLEAYVIAWTGSVSIGLGSSA